MWFRKVNKNGQKSRYITSNEDRTLVYKDWLRTQNLNGYAMDIDSIIWRRINGVPTPKAIFELTKTDERMVGMPYLQAIINRYFQYELQGSTVQELSKRLNVPAFIVLFNAKLEWLWVYSMEVGEWKEYSKSSWSSFIRSL